MQKIHCVFPLISTLVYVPIPQKQVFFASLFLWSKTLSTSLIFCGLCVCFLVISVAYIRIYRGLRHQHGHQVHDQAQVQAQQQAGNTLDVVRYRSSASSMLWIYSLFILCYLPYFGVRFVSAFLLITIMSSFIALLSSP